MPNWWYHESEKFLIKRKASTFDLILGQYWLKKLPSDLELHNLTEILQGTCNRLDLQGAMHKSKNLNASSS